MATAVSSMRPPPTLPPLTGIYAGKFKDRNPDIKAAGKSSEVGLETAAVAISDVERPESPAPTKKFHRTFRPEAGQRTIFYGKSGDPQLTAAESMTHGVAYRKGESASLVLNPTPLTLYQQRFLDKLEAAHGTGKKRPLGRCPDGKELGLLPKDLDLANRTFGISVQKFGSAGELLNPDRSRSELQAAEAADHDSYLVSHKWLLPGEQASRGYSSSSSFEENRRGRRWGKATPHDNAGGGARSCMTWTAADEPDRRDALVEKRLDDFRERTQFQLGRPLDPIKDTMKVSADHTFGILHKPDPHGVGDLLHGRAPKHFLRGQDRRRALVAALRTQLKKMNFEKFADMRSAFEFYDRGGSGKLGAEEMRAVCAEFSVPVDDSLLEQLIDFCDVDGDGRIDWKEFANFLNWRDISVRSDSSFGRSDSDVEKLSQQIDKSIGSHSTTNSMYSGGGGGGGRLRAYGCPTIRSDLPAPAVRSVSERRSFGNEGDAAACLNPSIFSQHGVWEMDLAVPRGKAELVQIFSKSGIELDEQVVDQVFNLIGKSAVGIDDFRAAWASVVRSEMQKQQQQQQQ